MELAIREFMLRRYMGWYLAIAAVLLVAVVLTVRYYFDPYHFAIVRDGVLYRDGVRTMREFDIALRKARPRTIVRLIDESEQRAEPFTSEAGYCRSHGIDLVELPIQLGGWPRPEQVDTFLKIVSDPKRQPVLVHCAQGVRRTGMMVAAYQESVLGYNSGKAKAAILRFRHSERTVSDVMKFIEVYNPAQRTLPTTLPVGKE
jgi:protein tyrosine/serine phosphatase